MNKQTQTKTFETVKRKTKSVKRREFLTTAVGTMAGTILVPAAVVLLPSARKFQDCSCGLVRYWKQPDGYYAAHEFDGRRMTYQLHCKHNWIHRVMNEGRWKPGEIVPGLAPVD